MYKNTSPVIILVEPQLAVNVGMIARVMLNFHFMDLRLVNPRDSNIISNAAAASAGADIILQHCKIYQRLADAVADCNLVFASTARTRYLDKPVDSLHSVFTNVNCNKLTIGFLFGKEANGLSNQDLNYANILINIITNPDFSSLNIVQSVALLCYEWDKQCNVENKLDIPKTFQRQEKGEIANFADLEHFFHFVESSLRNKSTITEPHKLTNVFRNFRNIFLRSRISKKEVKTLYRVIKSLQTTDSHK